MTVFVPDVGFRSSSGLAMPEPVTVTDGEHRGLMVMRLVSTELGTEIAIEVRDPERQHACLTGGVDYTWPQRTEVRLRDDAGALVQRSPGPGYGSSMGQHSFGFFGLRIVLEPLPPDASEVTLEVRGALGDWEVPLRLVPLAETAVVPAQPVGAKQERNGVTMRVVGIATTEDATILDVEATAGSSVKAIQFGEWLNHGKDGFTLVDDAGRRLMELSMRSRMNMRRAGGKTAVTFPRTESQRLTLVVPAVVLQESEGSLELQLPIFAPTDVMFGRHPVRIRYASFVNDLPAAPGEESRPGIEIQMGTVARDGDRQVLSPGPVFVDGVHQDYSVSRRSEPDFVSVNVPLAEGATARTVMMRDPIVAVRGPWEITFNRP